MHARIDQLLSLRDGEPVEAEVRVHVQHCAYCLAEAARLAKTRTRLQELPAFDPPTDVWPRIQEQAAVRPARRAPLGMAAAAAAALIVGVVAVIVVRDTPNAPQLAEKPVVETRPSTVPDSDMQTLIAQSRELDQLLEYLPQRPQVERVSLAATVDSIEERIQILDWQLAYGPDVGLDRSQARRLWSERVELMDSLVKVRYAESAPMTF